MMRWRLVEVTPLIAEQWLMGAIHPIRSDKVDALVCLMEQGRWEARPMGIVFHEDGKLCNGHHRLKAVVKHGKPVRVWVYK